MCFICSFTKLLLFLQHPYCTVIETTQFFTQMKNPAAAPIPSVSVFAGSGHPDGCDGGDRGGGPQRDPHQGGRAPGERTQGYNR